MTVLFQVAKRKKGAGHLLGAPLPTNMDTNDSCLSVPVSGLVIYIAPNVSKLHKQSLKLK